jgi:hypothetical protein
MIKYTCVNHIGIRKAEVE